MTAIAYQAMENKKHIFLQAPTGVGKTISTLYPALKELGAEKAENIFYLTAKTITRTVAEDTIKPVSYTHLDGYKRQEVNSWPDWN